jgi:hypothetical protein
MKKLSKKCQTCGKEYFKGVNTSMKKWEASKFCSRSCINKGRQSWLKGKKRPYDSPGSFKKGHDPWNKGKEWPEMFGENNPAWRGNHATMVAHHNWIKRQLGRPQKCEHCGTTEDRMYHWANKSGEYKRDVGDYIRLCVPCHKKYDMERIKSVGGRTPESVKHYGKRNS